MKIIGQENLPVMTYLEAILPADALLFSPRVGEDKFVISSILNHK